MANKESRSIQEQIELLKDRGMKIDNEEFARLRLNHISYYRLKGYWWDMQKDKEHHIFIDESRFEDVISRNSFDKELRLILFDAIEAIEIALRTKMLYHLSQSYGGLYYMDKGLFINEDLHRQHTDDLMGEFMRSGEVFIILLSGKNKLKALYPFIHRCCSRFTYPWTLFSVLNCKHYKMCLF